MLNSPFCRGLPRIFNILLRSLNSTQATVRSKAIKSVVQLLEKDPAILERSGNVLSYIVNSTSDSSPMVRDAALGLIGKCMSLRPSLESEGCKTLISRTLDTATTVRKRALRLLRELYPRTKNREVKIAVADAILRRVTDIEESVHELARQMIEEMWLHPYHLSISGELSTQVKQDMQQHAYHIVATTMRSSDSLGVFETLIHDSLVKTNKTAEANKAVCKALVVSLFDGVIDNDAKRGTPAQAELLQTMTAFAKAEACLFNAEQMTLLRPYIQNLATDEDLVVYRAVIIIYRNGLPVLPPLQQSFLADVQTVLCTSVAKLPKAELREAAACLWIIDDVLKSPERLVKMVRSVIVGLHNLDLKAIVPGSLAFAKAKRLLMLTGAFGKACDFEAFRGTFQEQLPKSKSETVSGMMIDVVHPLASPDLDNSIRCEALEALCLISQSTPKNFLKASVTTSFSTAFHDNDPKLALAIVTGVRDFYMSEEERSKSRAADQAIGDTSGTDRLAKSMILSDHDGAATSIAQQFLPHIIRLALSSVDELALVCAEVMASTDRQGLVHPKETGPALVALETSPNALIAQLAFSEHQALHSKHESVLEPEYVKAVERAFIYQKDIIKSVSGIDSNQQPKLRLFFEVLKSGSVGLRRKLLGKLCTRSLLDVNKLESMEHTVSHLQSVCFTLQNLSTLEYSRIDEVTSMLSAIEKAFSTTGNVVSQRIEGSSITLSSTTADKADQAQSISTLVNPNQLRHLAACSTVLTLLWETRTFLRKAWGLQSLRLNGKAKAQAKDTSKAPNKATNYPSLVKDHLAQLLNVMTSLNSPEAMTARCHSFVEMLAVDSELKVASDEDENGQPRYKTPEDDEQEAEVGTPASNGAPGSGRGRKRKAGSIGGTPRKPKLNHKPSMSRKGSRARSRSRGVEDDDLWE
jgi:cohesin loading factor subunit SCC2